MARVFISFAIEDRILRDFLIGQKNNSRTQIEFTDYSVKEPWDSAWKTNCRARIKLCRGVVGIVTHNTPRADGQLWELKCAAEEAVPTLLLHGYQAPEKKLVFPPPVLAGRTIFPWTEQNLVAFLNQLG